MKMKKEIPNLAGYSICNYLKNFFKCEKEHFQIYIARYNESCSTKETTVVTYAYDLSIQ